VDRAEAEFRKARDGEVRRCPRCAQPSAVLIVDWQEEVYGIKTGVTTREYRCQSCGGRFKIHGKRENTIIVLLGVVLLFFVLPAGLLLLFIAWRRARLAAKAPVQPDARIPSIRYQEGPPRRRCAACANLCRPVRVAKESHNGIPLGMEIDYECSGCGRQFAVGTTGFYITLAFTALFFLGAAAGFWIFQGNLWKYAGAFASGAFGLWLASDLVRKARDDFANPRLPDPGMR
jgi:hypothetical protein